MKIAALICRILLGLIFVVFGANGLHPFLPMQANATRPARDFVMALFQSHYAVVIFAVQFIGAILLLVNRYVPLALTFLGAVIVNIDCYHVFMDHPGFPRAAFVTILWFVLFYYYRRSFAGILEHRPI
jgi:putative oxidoreductase